MFVILIVVTLTVRTSYSKIAHKKDIRVIGGKDGEYRKYSYVGRLERKLGVALESTNQNFLTLIIPLHSCSCTILTSNWTLTAAHCVPKESDRAQLFVRYGSERPGDDNATVVLVLSYRTHPSFRIYDLGIMPLTVENDVAVLNTEPIILPRYGRLSAVEYSSLFGQEAKACGYGLTNDTDDKGITVISDTLILNKPLQVLDVMMMSCSSKLIHSNVHPALCMARKCGRKAAMCPGDSGGPLLHKSGVVGVISLGAVYDCVSKGESSNLIGVMTAISPFIEWIGNIINEK